MEYDYRETVRNDVIEQVKDGYKENSLRIYKEEGREVLEEYLNNELWVDDQVTGNASGSYTFNTWEAEENLCHNMNLLEEACDEFGQDVGEAVKRGAEYCDVTIRCYLLGSAISEAIDELEAEGYFEEELNRAPLF